jgi:hypothetical protein
MTLCLLTYYAAGQSLLVAAFLGHVLLTKSWRNRRAIRGMSVWDALWLPLFPLLMLPLLAYLLALAVFG